MNTIKIRKVQMAQFITRTLYNMEHAPSREHHSVKAMMRRFSLPLMLARYADAWGAYLSAPTKYRMNPHLALDDALDVIKAHNGNGGKGLDIEFMAIAKKHGLSDSSLEYLMDTVHGS